MPTDERNRFARGMGEGYAYVGAAFAFALAILLFGAGGWLLDGWLHTRPAFAIVGALIGGFGGFMSIYYRVQRDVAQRKREKDLEAGEGKGRGKGA
jgi:F0F1-type ATP synthase assembly protein I